MLDGLKPYPAYKDSGVPWLGKVPAHWQVMTLRQCARVMGGMTPSMADRSFWGGEIPWVTPKDMKRYRIADSIDHVSQKALDATALSIVPAPAVLLVVRGMILARRVPVAITEAPVTLNQDMKALLPAAHMDAGFLGSTLLAARDGLTVLIDEAGHGTKRLPTERWRSLPIPVAPLSEQTAIVRFLDHADRCVRKYIRSKEMLVKLIEEERRAVIGRAVTRGLDSGARLKSSGVNWLPSIPEHWKVKRLGQLASSFRTGPFGSVLHESDYIEDGIPVVNPTHMRGGRIVEDRHRSVASDVLDSLSAYRLERGDLVFSRRGELGRCALVRAREAGWLCGTGSIRVRVAYDGIDPEFLCLALQHSSVGEYLSSFSVGATMESLNTGILKGVTVALPPIDEQRRLVIAIEDVTREMDRASAAAEREIVLSRELLVSLTADVVTGRLDVGRAADAVQREIGGAGGIEPGDDVEEEDVDETEDEASSNEEVDA